jgi:hypothetical protein
MLQHYTNKYLIESNKGPMYREGPRGHLVDKENLIYI